MTGNGRDTTATLLDFVTSTSAEAIPEAARTACRTFLLDSLGVAAAGSAAPWAENLTAIQGKWGAGDAARCWVFGDRLPAASAAFSNAYMIHNSEFDCIHEAAVVHPMAVLLPAAMADAERTGGVSGADFLTALILGVETACTIGVAATGGMRFFRPATAGAFGAVAAIARLRGFDAATLRNAMGAVYSQLSGTMQAHTEGSVLLAMQAGFSARNAVVACDLAEAGIAAPQDMLEGEFGYFALFEESADFASAIARLGDPWRITEVAHKPFPSGRATHGVLDALLELQRHHGFAAADIVHIEARVPPLTYQLVARPPWSGMPPNQARLCIAYAAARAMQRGTLGVGDFTPVALSDGDTFALAKRISVSKDDNPDPTALAPVRVHVSLVGDQKLEREQAVIYGNPAKPMTRDAHLEKFRSNWRAAARPLPADNAERLIDDVGAIQSIVDMREIVALLV